MTITVICRESGDMIQHCNSIYEAEKTIQDYEMQDKRDGNFTPNFYQIRTKDNDGNIEFIN